MDDISTEQRKELFEALISAFPNKQDLEIMIGIELGEKTLNSISGDTVPTLVFNLIRTAESQGEFDKLIKRAYEYNPKNPKLEKFYNKYYTPKVLDKIVSRPDDDLILIWNKLYEILEIPYKNNLIDNQLLTKICKETLQNSTNDLLGNCSELLSGNLNLTQLQDILIKKFPERKDNVPTIVEFAERLSNEANKDLSTQLMVWVKTIAESKIPKIPLPTYDKTPLSRGGKYYYFLFVIANPDLTAKNKFNLGAELVLYNADKYESCGGFLQEPIKNCDLSEIKNKIKEIVKKCENSPDVKCPYIINIQLFLPYKYLGYNFDTENIQDNNDSIYLGKEHPFLVSPYERFYEKTEKNKFLLRWDDLTHQLQNDNFANLMAACQDVTKYDDQDLSELADQWGADNIIGLKIVGCWYDDQNIQAQLFKCVVKSGIPFVLWVRHNDLPSYQEQLNKLLNSHKFNTWQDLFNKVQEYRRRASFRKQEDLGCHLGILADHPQRIPACFDKFTQLGQ